LVAFIREVAFSDRFSPRRNIFNDCK
jgi:hypothetical protein